MSNINRAPGQSDSNVKSKGSANNFIETVRKLQGLPCEITMDEIEGEKLKVVVTMMCFWLSEKAIPFNFDDNLRPRNPENKRCLTAKTISQYIGMWLVQVRSRFPEHEDFRESLRDKTKPTTPWWSELKAGFEKAADRFQLSQGDDIVFGVEPIYPLYKDNGKPIGDVINDPVSCIDVKNVLLYLVKNAQGSSGNLQKRCWVSLTSDCIGRGGEFRFQNYDDWTWHPGIQVLDIKWKEMKTITSYAMGIVPDLTHWLFDFYHCFGSFFMVEDGLARTEKEIQEGKVNAVFPSVLYVTEASTTRKLTGVIRTALRGSTLLANRYSARSLRYGAITELGCHREIDVFDCCARSGHSTGTTIDSYIDNRNPAYGLKAGMARCGYNYLGSDLKKKIQVPCLEALGSEVGGCVEKLLEKAFVVSVPHFKREEGKLYTVLRICLATLILYYPEVVKECGGDNAICQRLNDAAREAGIRDTRFGNVSTEKILVGWSKIISTDLAIRRMPVSIVNPDLVSIAFAQTQVISMLSDLTKQNHSLVQRNADMENKIAALSSELASHKEASRKSAMKLSVLRTPQQAGKKRTQDEMLDDLTPATLFPSDDRLSVSPSAPTRTPVKGRSTSTVSLRSEKKKNGGETDKKFLFDLLIDYRETLNEHTIHHTTIASGIAEKSCLRYCFELLDYVVKHDETAKDAFLTFKKKDTSRDEYVKRGRALVEKCMDQMYVFEGSDPALMKKVQGRQHNTTYRGIGNRVGNYKLALMNLRKQLDPNLVIKKINQELKLKSEIQVTGTPPGNHSIRKLFRPSETTLSKPGNQEE